MSEAFIQVPVDSTGKKIHTHESTIGANVVEDQVVVDINVAQAYGTWAYYAGAFGTVVVSAGQRVISIAAHSTVGGSLSINGGSSVAIPANAGFSLGPKGNLTAPTIVFTGTDSYFVEVVS